MRAADRDPYSLPKALALRYPGVEIINSPLSRPRGRDSSRCASKTPTSHSLSPQKRNSGSRALPGVHAKNAARKQIAVDQRRSHVLKIAAPRSFDRFARLRRAPSPV